MLVILQRFMYNSIIKFINWNKENDGGMKMEEENNPIKEMGTKTMEPNVGQSSSGQTSQANSVEKK